ncbi:GNAT family N-acetyltransferase [Streptomyces sp. NPDC014894]|uniref:GNAT family N-acetyltransferase n=1 Tax=Streptomyces sp. NPDC014894 TaxID=3364931 RepID=UPI0036FAD4C2
MFGASLGAGALILAVADGEPVGASIRLPRSGGPEPSAPPAGGDPTVRRLSAVQRATDLRRPGRAHLHLHLQSMAVRPEHRRRGAGAAMLASGPARADELGLPVRLEASTSEDRRLYERLGCRDLGEPIRLPEGGPSPRPMWFES